ncbi:MAG: nucleotidyltransferase domain-containing protein [Chloroflexota bacterium]
MRLQDPLDDLFATGSHVRVLRALAVLPPTAAVSGRELARRARVSQPTTRDVLASLERQGLLLVTRSLKRDAYRLNPDHVLVPVVRDLFDRERSVGEDVEMSIAAVVRKLPGVRAAYLFGSAARGDMRPDSDLDVAIESPRPIPEDSPELEAFHGRFGNRINIIRLPTRGAAGLRERIREEGKALPLRSARRKS